MIIVNNNRNDFEYDIHSLVKAFFPPEDVVVITPGNPRTDQISGKEILAKIDIVFLEASETQAGADSIRCSFESQKEQCADKRAVHSRDAAADFSKRLITKDALKQCLYHLLQEATGQNLPWGSLTGIRPAKIPMKMMEEGHSDEEIRAHMKETYFTSDPKIDLCMTVAKKERDILNRLDAKNGYSLYVGIPFCPTTCAYCSFTSYPLAKWAERVDEYLDALEKEIRFTGEYFDQTATGIRKNGTGAVERTGEAGRRHLDTVYIGGGTPTTLLPHQMDRLLTMLETHLDLSGVHEFTVEGGRPDSITREKLEVLRAHQISRISINPQTMQQKTLDLIGRRHAVEQTKESFLLAREVGFTNINMDLIVGLPEETIADVEDTLKQIEVLAPDNLTIHSLAIKRAARLKMQQEDFSGMHMENTWETIDLTAAYCEKMGLEPYYMYRQKNMAGNFENVGYARPGCEGLYNILIMEEKQTIMALGAGAITKFVLWPKEAGLDDSREAVKDPRIVRVENVKDISNYLERADEMIERKRSKMEELGLI
ncbi:MAG: coproporphyrinogen dehydrogenase HemZ [Eubacterium sp.]|nr:coproporphyrinogen dehydrogenase HemZ [Eubacterium sp.]